MKNPTFAVRSVVNACALFCVAASPFTAHAQSTQSLDKITVTATRVPTLASDALAEILVIDRATIDSCASMSLPELLARQAGLQMSLSGGLGKLGSVFTRGTEARHTLLLIDGVRYGSATAGIPIWDNIPLDAIERVEVVKGAASALYGSDAVGGVVQVFTRSGAAKAKPRFNATATAGSYGRTQLGLGVTGSTGEGGALRYAVSGQRLRESGFSATNANVPFGNFNPDNDGFSQDSFSASLGYTLNNWALDAKLLKSNGLVPYDDGLNRDTQNRLRTEVWSLGAGTELMPGWKTQLSHAQSTDRSEGVVGAFLPNLFATRQTETKWQNTVASPIGSVLAGLEAREQAVTSSTAYTAKSRSINGVYLGLLGKKGAHSWQANVRRDQNSQFGGATTDYAAYGLQLGSAWRVNVASASSFVAPSFNQLYFPNFGNPNLQPERGRNNELGLRWTDAGHEMRVTAFDNKIRGFITNTTVAANIPRARIEGTSVAYSGDVAGYTLRATLDSLNPRNELTGKQLPRRAKNQSSVGVDRRSGQFAYGATVLSVGERFEDAANSANRRMEAYTTVDAHLRWVFLPEYTAQLQLVNLANQAYETAYGYNSAGRSAYLSLRWAPK